MQTSSATPASLHAFVFARCHAQRSIKHKQEVSALKSDIQKLQLESKTGGKSKELAAKEMEALKWVWFAGAKGGRMAVFCVVVRTHTYTHTHTNTHTHVACVSHMGCCGCSGGAIQAFVRHGTGGWMLCHFLGW